MFANGPGDLDSNPGRVLPKTQKMVLDASLVNTQRYKVGVVAIEKGALGSPSTKFANLWAIQKSRKINLFHGNSVLGQNSNFIGGDFSVLRKQKNHHQ